MVALKRGQVERGGKHGYGVDLQRHNISHLPQARMETGARRQLGPKQTRQNASVRKLETGASFVIWTSFIFGFEMLLPASSKLGI